MREGRVAASVDQNVSRCAALGHESVGPSHKCAEIFTHKMECTYTSRLSWETDILYIWKSYPEMPWNGTWTSNLALTLQLIHWEKEHEWAVKRWAQWITHAISQMDLHFPHCLYTLPMSSSKYSYFSSSWHWSLKRNSSLTSSQPAMKPSSWTMLRSPKNQ